MLEPHIDGDLAVEISSVLKRFARILLREALRRVASPEEGGEGMGARGGMARGRRRGLSALALTRGLLLLCLLVALASFAIAPAEAAPKSKGGRGKKRKGSQFGLMDKEYHLARDQCTKDIQGDEGGRYAHCAVSDVTRENCVLKCVSPECYEKLYGNDPLEEGELDTTRGRLFRNCLKTELRKQKQKEAEAEKREL